MRSGPEPTPVPEGSVRSAIVIGHRGSPGHLPDHTLEGYALAVRQGADFIEPDLVSTSDGHLIARHENELSHTTDVATRFPDRKATKTVDGEAITGWFAEDFTLAEIGTLRAVQPFASRPHDHDGEYAIPTFDAILALRAELSAEVGREIGVYPETKHPSYFDAAGLSLEAPMLAALRAHGLDRADAPVFVQSFELANLDALAAQSEVPRILLVGDLDATPFGDSRTYGELLADPAALRGHVRGVGVHKSHLWSESGPTGLLEKLHAGGLLVHVYTFRNEADQLGPAAAGDPRRELQRFLDLGVDGVFADYPDVAVGVRGR
ncbi:MAG: glycerophosphodiester phosphodiesterase [Alphaproteobacteria bacterium]|nr:glycerophosphodiester phosphodiesterase [Alphaproteobacteria bacterium]